LTFVKIPDVLFNFQGSNWTFEVESFASHLSVIYLYYINTTSLSTDWAKFFFGEFHVWRCRGAEEACRDVPVEPLEHIGRAVSGTSGTH